MPAFRFFDPWEALNRAKASSVPAKRANPAKVEAPAPSALATSAGLAASRSKMEFGKRDTVAVPDQTTDPAGRGVTESEHAAIVEWLNAHPVSSDPETCCWCGRAEREDDVLLPFGVESTGHAWLHSACWRPWSEHRRAEAVAALLRWGP